MLTYTLSSSPTMPLYEQLYTLLKRDIVDGVIPAGEKETTMDCLFCSIAAGRIPSTQVWSDEVCVAFRDIAPQAPTHILVIPRRHIPSVDGVDETNSAAVAHIFEVIPKIAAAEGLTGGYRVVSNCGPDACQSVPHLHFHLLGGTQLSGKMV